MKRVIPRYHIAVSPMVAGHGPRFLEGLKDEAWLGHFRRLVVRYERLVTTYSGLFHLACAMLTLKRVLK
jgi:transposase